MLSIARVFVAFHTAAYLALVGFTPSLNIALANPLPMPLMKNYSASYPDEAGPPSKTLKTTSSHNSSHSTHASRSLLSTRSIDPRQQDIISALTIYVSDAGLHANDLRTWTPCLIYKTCINIFNLEQCATSCPGSPEAQQQPSASSLSLFSNSLLGFQHTVSDKGLAYFDKNSGLEVLIRKIIDETKYILNYTNDLVQCYPLLSALLGPSTFWFRSLALHHN